ncbi:MAG: hypothetical protein OHK0015_47630 [Chloroflexi bacterium OHK40]
MRRVLPGRRLRPAARALRSLLRTARTPADLRTIAAALQLAARIAALTRAWRPRRLRRLATLGALPALALALLGAPTVARGQPPDLPQPFTDELPVNTTTPGDFSAVAMSPTGDFVVTWIDQEVRAVVARLYDERGRPVRGPFLVSPVGSVETGFQSRPDVAMDAEGNFVVVWPGDDRAAEISEGLFAQRFDAEGDAIGLRLVVTSNSSDPLLTPSVAMAHDGRFAVAWHDTSANDDTIRVQRFSAEDLPLPGPDGPIASGFFNGLSIAMDADGDFALAWSESNTVYATRYDATSGALIPVNDGQPLHEVRSGSFFNSDPAVAMDADGDFAVVWDESDDGLGRVVGRRFDRDGRQVGGELVVDSDDNASSEPRAAMLDGDLLAVAWDDEENDQFPVQLAFFRPGSITPDYQETVNPQNNNGVASPDIAANTVGSLVVGWSSRTFDTAGNAEDNVFARLYASPVTYSAGTSTAGTTEASGARVTFTIFRDGITGGRGSVRYHFDGTAGFGRDYVISGGTAEVSTRSGTIAFAPGERARTIELTIIDDTISEPNKSILLELSEPLPTGLARISFPLAVVTLGDDDLAEVQVRQTGGSTVVVRGGAGDELTVALRTAPTAPVEVTLTPTSRQLNLGMGWGVARTLTFEPGESAKTPQMVRIFTVGGETAASQAANSAIAITARSDDPAYGVGARITVDGKDRLDIPVNLVEPPSSGPGIVSVHLPLIRR